MKTDELSILRHSSAHVLAAAVLDLYPSTKPTIGPSTDEGFYYDFDFDDVKISEDDLSKIEEKMHQLVKDWNSFERKEVSSQEAGTFFKDNPYKLELIKELEKEGQVITLYTSGNFTDLCRGGHVTDPGSVLKHFKLLSIAGAYWRGSEKNKMLTRIYGTAFPTKEELEKHLWQLEETKKRDHRKLGRELELFTFDDLVGPGLPLWLPNGTVIREEVEKFAKETERLWGYQRVVTPHLAKKELFETSGHLPYYADSMYPPMELDDGDYYLKAMNCPHTHLIYRHKPRSYRELPLRFAEYGTVYRHELSGTLAGLLRVRGMSMNDAHIYCTREQIKSEFLKVLELHRFYYDVFGIKDYYMRLSLHDPEKKGKYIDEPEMWAFSENAIREAMKESGLPYIEAVGEAAFYGPKIDFQIKTVVGREESASTNQLDFAAAQRFNLSYIDNEAQEQKPFVIHRAPLGTHERFVAFLIEHFAGAFPVWLAPVQVVLLPLSEKFVDFAIESSQLFEKAGIRMQVNKDNKPLGAKIRESALQKIPYLCIIGEKEVTDSSVSVRTREGKDLGLIKISDFIQRLLEEIGAKT